MYTGGLALVGQMLPADTLDAEAPNHANIHVNTGCEKVAELLHQLLTSAHSLDTMGGGISW